MPYALNCCLPDRVNIVLVFMCLCIYLYVFFHSHTRGYAFQILNRAGITNVISCSKNDTNWNFFQMQTSYPLMNRRGWGELNRSFQVWTKLLWSAWCRKRKHRIVTKHDMARKGTRGGVSYQQCDCFSAKQLYNT